MASGKAKVYINGLLIENVKVENSLDGEEEVLVIDIPTYLVVEKKNADIVRLDIDDSDADSLENITRLDTSRFIGKKIKMIISIVGNAARH
jgi:hypothetical protein